MSLIMIHDDDCVARMTVANDLLSQSEAVGYEEKELVDSCTNCLQHDAQLSE